MPSESWMLLSDSHCLLQRMTFLEGYPGVLALQAVCYRQRGKESEALAAAQVSQLVL